jgi:hypothetical protein
MRSRLPEEFRDRTKRFAARTIRLFIKLPKAQEDEGTQGPRTKDDN